MSTPVKFDFDANSGPMERAWQTGTQLVEKLIREVAAITPAAQQADAAAKSLNKATEDLGKHAAKLRASLVTPQSEYAEKLRVATQLLNAQEISEGEYAAAVDKAREALEAQDGTLRKTQQDAAKLAATQAEMANQGAKLRASLVTPQSEYAEKLRIANQLLNAQEISEGEYAAAVDKAKAALEAQDGTLKKAQADTARLAAAQNELVNQASKLRASLVTPQSEYAEKIRIATQLLNAEEISEGEYAAAVDKARAALEAQDGTLAKVQADTAKVTAAQKELANQGARLRASLVTPQSEYADKLRIATQLLNAQEISEGEYAAAVDQAKAALDAKDESLQESLRLAEKIRQAAVTPEQSHAAAIARAKMLLDQKLITQKQYDAELVRQNRLLREAKTAQEEFHTYGQKAQQSLGTTLETVALKAVAVSTAYNLVRKSVAAVVQENTKFNESVQKTIDMAAAEELKLQIKAGLLPSQVEAKMPDVQNALMATPVTDMAGGVAIQAQIESSGFSRQDIDNNQALQASLDIKAATNGFRQAPADITKATQAIAMFHKSMGNLVPTAKDIRGTGAGMTALFKESEIEFNDLAQLAQKSATISAFGLSEQEMLGTYSTLRDQIGAEKGATGFAAFISRTATAAGNDERKKALKSVGLKPQDVDIAKGGDQFIDVAEKLLAKKASMSEEKWNTFLNEMYGEEGATAANTILNRRNLDQIKNRIAMQGDPTEFEKNLASYRGSREARNMRTKLTLDFANREIDKQRGGTTWKEARDAQEAQRAQMQAEGSISGTRRAFGAAFANYVWNPVAEGLGYAPPTVETLQGMRIKGDANSPLEQAVNQNAQGKAAVTDREIRAMLNQPLNVGGFDAIVVQELKGLREDLKAKPPAPVQVNVNVKRPTNATPKTPASAALASSGGK